VMGEELQLTPAIERHLGQFQIERVRSGAYVQARRDDRGRIVATSAEIAEAIKEMAGWGFLAEKAVNYSRLSIGRLIIDYQMSYPINIEVDDVIEELGLVELLGKSRSTIYRWTKVVRYLDPRELALPLSDAHFMAAAWLAPPIEREASEKFQEGRRQILIEAARSAEKGDPKKPGWVKQQVRSMAQQLGMDVMPKYKPDVQVLQEACLVFWLYGWPDQRLNAQRIARRELADLITIYEAELQRRDLLPDEADVINLPSQSVRRDGK